MRDSIFFSIVIATYNVKIDLEICVNSIQSQSFLNYELLISDGGSSDGTLEYISSGAIANLAWYKSEPDTGIYDALNIALDHISGNWVLVMGADDRLADPEALSRAYNQISRLRVNAGIVYSDLFISGNKGVVLKKYPAFAEFERKYNGGAFIHHQTAFINKECLMNAGKFSLNYKVHADYDLMLRVLIKSGALKIDGAFVVFHSKGFSSRFGNLWKSFCEIYRIRQSHGYFPMPTRLLMTYTALLTRRIFPFT